MLVYQRVQVYSHSCSFMIPHFFLPTSGFSGFLPSSSDYRISVFVLFLLQKSGIVALVGLIGNPADKAVLVARDGCDGLKLATFLGTKKWEEFAWHNLWSNKWLKMWCIHVQYVYIYISIYHIYIYITYINISHLYIYMWYIMIYIYIWYNIYIYDI